MTQDNKALFFIIGITSILLITIILSILIEWLGIAFDWWHLEKHQKRCLNEVLLTNKSCTENLKLGFKIEPIVELLEKKIITIESRWIKKDFYSLG